MKGKKKKGNQIKKKVLSKAPPPDFKGKTASIQLVKDVREKMNETRKSLASIRKQIEELQQKMKLD